MTSIINYILEFNVFLLLFSGVYYFLFRKESNFNFRRNIILIGTVLAVLLPLIPFTSSSPVLLPVIPEPITRATTQASAYVLEGITITAEENAGINWIRVLFWIGVSFSSIFIARMFFGILMVFRLVFSAEGKKYRKSRMMVVEHPKAKGVFTFFNYLFVANNNQLTPEVMAHEEVHSKGLHTIDILLISFLKALFWINPALWFLKKELQNLHEFIADQKALSEFDLNTYTKLLLNEAVPGLQLSVGHYLNKSLTIKRLHMMKMKKLPIQKWKVYSASLLIGAFAVLISCTNDVVEDLDNVLETATQLEVPAELEADLKRLQKENPNADYAYVEFDMESQNSAERLQDVAPGAISLIKVYEDRKTAGIIFDKNSRGLNTESVNVKIIEIPESEYAFEATDGVFTVVEEPAVPKEGMTAFYDYISQNLKYPEQAKNAGVEGRVYVQFVVSETGEITNVKSVKGIGAGCDDEAVRVIQNAAAWNPARHKGQIVKHRMIVPINFALNSSNLKENSDNGFIEEFEIEIWKITQVNQTLM